MAWWRTKEPKKSEVVMENDTDLYLVILVLTSINTIIIIFIVVSTKMYMR